MALWKNVLTSTFTYSISEELFWSGLYQRL